MLLLNPNTGKPVDVSAEFVDRFVRAGFKKQEPAVEQKAPVRKGRSRSNTE